VIFPQAEAVRVCEVAHAHGMAAYLDGARLWNVAAATGLTPAELAAPFDMVMVAFSKGLGAPGGSMLAGSRAMIADAVRHRRLLGGAMRQIGFFAAAALHALDHNMARLAEDHANARLLAAQLAQVPGIALDLSTVQTNIIIFRLTDEAPATAEVLARAKAQDVLVSAFGPRTLRAVTHLDVTTAQCRRAGDVLAGIIGGR
jgi:threonine aldolase